MRNKFLFLILFSIFVVLGNDMLNSNYIYTDSIWVDATDTVFSSAFPIDEGAHLTMILEARDDSAAAIGGDSACVRVELWQSYPIFKGGRGYLVTFPSKAQPDSTYPSPDWVMYDSLDIADMDTAAAYMRDLKGADHRKTKIWGDSLVISDTLGNFGAMEYFAFSPDATPSAVLRFIGRATNKRIGPGSRWIVRIQQNEESK